MTLLSFLHNNCFRKMESEKPLKNKWYMPVDAYGHTKRKRKSLRSNLEKLGLTLELTRNEWKHACSTVNKVLNILLKDLHCQAKYEELKIMKEFICQGSARQYLKVHPPFEFDVIVPFNISGLEIEMVEKEFPGEMLLKILNNESLKDYPDLGKNNVFHKKGKTFVLSSKELQEKVLKSILDRTLVSTGGILENEGYEVKRTSSPPRFKITIIPKHEQSHDIDVDLVLALALEPETIEIPLSDMMYIGPRKLIFPKYAAMKWKPTEVVLSDDKDEIWRNCTSSYEIYLFDLCKGNKERQFILSACRIVKAAINLLMEKSNFNTNIPTSYHLKTVTMYCILLLTIPSVKSTRVCLHGVCDALGYFVKFLELALEERYLPNFFFGNNYLQLIFPESQFTKGKKKHDLFQTKQEEEITASKKIIKELRESLKEFFPDEEPNSDVVNYFTAALTEQK